MNKIVDVVNYDPNVPYQQIIDQKSDQVLYGQRLEQKPDELASLIKNINIPDKVEFEHIYKLNQPCFGENSQHSSFDIQGIGELTFGLTQPCCNPTCYCFCFACIDCDAHSYPDEIYKMENQNIKMEFWHQGIGKVQVKDTTLFEFIQTNPNYCDVFCQHCLSSYPKLKIKFPSDKNKQLVLRPDRNQCPESILGGLTFTSYLDIFTTTKYYYVDGLTQGKCQIINSRNSCQALAKISACGGCCYGQCPLINYPKYSVVFENVAQIDKIAIIMGLVHSSFYKQWIFTGTNLFIWRQKACCCC